MYRGPTPGSPGGGTTSPGVSAMRPSVFSPPLYQGNPNAAARIPSGSRPASDRRDSSLSEEGSAAGLPSPPQMASSYPVPGPTNAGGSAIAGNKLRPLRLVQAAHSFDAPEGSDLANDAADVAAKKAKRGSWMGWFNKGKVEDGTPGGPASFSASAAFQSFASQSTHPAITPPASSTAIGGGGGGGGGGGEEEEEGKHHDF